MKLSIRKFSVMSGFVAAIACIQHGYASNTPTSAGLETSEVSDLRAQKTGTPDLDGDLSRLNNLERSYVEGGAQRARLQKSTATVARKLRAKKRASIEE